MTCQASKELKAFTQALCSVLKILFGIKPIPYVYNSSKMPWVILRMQFWLMPFFIYYWEYSFFLIMLFPVCLLLHTIDYMLASWAPSNVSLSGVVCPICKTSLRVHAEHALAGYCWCESTHCQLHGLLQKIELAKEADISIFGKISIEVKPKYDFLPIQCGENHADG